MTTVRPLNAEHDLERLRVLHGEAFPAVVPFVASDGTGDDDLALGVDDADGGLMAYLYAQIRDDELVHIWELGVHPAARGRRLGHALLRHVAELCGPLGLPLVTVTPMGALGAGEQSRLTAYFERCGFRTVDPLEAMEASPAEVLAALA